MDHISVIAYTTVMIIAGIIALFLVDKYDD
jgi:hypothetical protein